MSSSAGREDSARCETEKERRKEKEKKIQPRSAEIRGVRGDREGNDIRWKESDGAGERRREVVIIAQTAS